MGANRNSSQEFGLYPKINPKPQHTMGHACTARDEDPNKSIAETGSMHCFDHCVLTRTWNQKQGTKTNSGVSAREPNLSATGG
jgi:hypothetical protein